MEARYYRGTRVSKVLITKKDSQAKLGGIFIQSILITHDLLL